MPAEKIPYWGKGLLAVNIWWGCLDEQGRVRFRERQS
jgi:hypothetical protein